MGLPRVMSADLVEENTGDFIQVGCDLVGATNLLAIVALVQRIYSSHRFGYYACYQTRIGSGRDFVWTEHANCA